MKLHYKLQDSPDPLHSDFVLPTLPTPTQSYHIYDTSILSSEVISYYKQRLDLDICLAILFVRPPRQSIAHRQNQGVIHSDITWSSTGWRTVHYGVNYELSSPDTILSWWSTTDPEIYPPYPILKSKEDNLRGIHYGKRSNFDSIADNYTLLDTVTMSVSPSPTLVSTGIPHSVNYFGHSTTRYGLSLRFTKDVDLWSDAVDHFSDIIL